jgi:hypothetical protein
VFTGFRRWQAVPDRLKSKLNKNGAAFFSQLVKTIERSKRIPLLQF